MWLRNNITYALEQLRLLLPLPADMNDGQEWTTVGEQHIPASLYIPTGPKNPSHYNCTPDKPHSASRLCYTIHSDKHRHCHWPLVLYLQWLSSGVAEHKHPPLQNLLSLFHLPCMLIIIHSEVSNQPFILPAKTMMKCFLAAVTFNYNQTIAAFRWVFPWQKYHLCPPNRTTIFLFCQPILWHQVINQDGPSRGQNWSS